MLLLLRILSNSFCPNPIPNWLHVALYPFAATTAKIFADNAYGNAITVDGLIPGQWNYVEVDNNLVQANYYLVELVGEIEFYLDHFYFTKPVGAITITDGADNSRLVWICGENVRSELYASVYCKHAIYRLETATGEVTLDDAAWYSLSGVRMQGKPSQKGVYIVNGKKVTIK